MKITACITAMVLTTTFCAPPAQAVSSNILDATSNLIDSRYIDETDISIAKSKNLEPQLAPNDEIEDKENYRYQ